VAILGAHETGHYLACRHYRIPATLPFFLPGIPPLGSFGAVIRIRGVIPNRRALFDVAAAGPIAGFLVALPVLVAGILRAEPYAPLPGEIGEPWGLGQPLVLALLGPLLPDGDAVRVNSLIVAGWVGMLVTSLNLCPVGQLDGGHAAYALSRRLHRFTARVAMVGLAMLVVVQVVALRQVPAYLLWLAVLFWMRDRHPRLLSEHEPLGTGRRVIALVLLLIFLMSFIPVPFVIVGS
jgi:membrane-associated protease RseP (regulator of RpoE activity)